MFNFQVHSTTWIDFCLLMALKSNQCFLLDILCFRFYITGYRTFNNLISFPNVNWLLLAYGVEVQKMFLLNVLCFFRLGHAVFTFVKPSSHGGIIFMQGDGAAVPLHPLRHSQLKM